MMMDVVLYIPTIQCGVQARNAYMVKFLSKIKIINLKKIKILMLIFVVTIFLVIVDVQSTL